MDDPHNTIREPRPTRAGRLRGELNANTTRFFMEAHNALSAKIVARAGFPGIWASGLSIASALGVRDCNEASWTQVLDVVEFMADAVDVPILLDGDTGYGNFNNVRRLVRKLEQRGIAGVCLEDKVFPKTNSLLGGSHELADSGEFTGKLRAACDARLDRDFCVVARIEALIAGAGMDEALRRADAYIGGGADAVLIHSKRRDADEVLTFIQRFQGQVPVILVPTTYAATPSSVFAAAGVAVVIWANHTLRAAVEGMRRVATHVSESHSVAGLDGQIAPLEEIFSLVNQEELAIAEAHYASYAHGSPSNAAHGSPSYAAPEESDEETTPLVVRGRADASVRQ